MVSTRTLVGLGVVVCVGAAAGGAYLASRRSAAVFDTGARGTQPLGSVSVPAQELAAGMVHETEATIEETGSTPVEAGEGAAGASIDKVAPTLPPLVAMPGRLAERGPSASAAAARSTRRTTADPPRRPQPSASSSTRLVETTTVDAGRSGLDKTWPSSAGKTAEDAGRVDPDRSASETLSVQGGAQSVAAAAEPPPPPRILEELVVSANAVMGLQLDTPVTSARARVEDRVEARVARDVKVGDRVAIPAGSRVVGSVTQVERGGKIKERARLGLRFHTLVLADGTRTALDTETVYREGASPAGESAAKIGGAAVGGAIIGAILGGTRGAVMGGTAGAAGGTAAVMAGDRNAATLPAGATVTVRLLAPVTIVVER